jgi:hypothetical protein
MGETKRRLEPVGAPSATTESSSSSRRREFLDPIDSDRRGLLGIVETVLRRFKILSHLALILPVYALGCIVIGAAVAPALALYELLSGFAAGQPIFLKYFILGSSAVASYLVYGFSLLFLTPLVNFLLRTRLKAWRGPYYSLEAVRWYVHNGATYIVRFTFLEFVTPTPFNILFYRMMGMTIGRGTTINTTWISDPSLIQIGKKVTIGGSVTLIGHYGQGGYLVLAPTRIGNGVTIGLKATIMGDVTIGDGAKVLPNSVVMPKTVIPADEVWGGVPARKLGT